MEHKTKILLIADGNHLTIKNLIERIIIDSKYHIEFDILSLSHNVNSFHNGIKIYHDIKYFIKVSGLLSKVPYIRGLSQLLYLNRLSLKLIENRYDFVHIHYTKWKHYFIIDLLGSKSISTITTIWGNDLNAINKLQRFFLYRLLNRIDAITYSSTSIRAKLLHYNSKYICKLHQCKFVNNNLVYLSRLNTIDKHNAKNLLGLPNNCFIITCGYTSKAEQNQLLIIQQLKKVSLPENCIIVFPMTYGNFRENIKKVKAELKKCRFKYFVLDNFLTTHELAIYRKASDIMINVVNQDQLSASFLEYLYSQNIVITGDWLPYSALIDEGIFFKQISKIAELSEVIPSIISEYDTYFEKTKNNPIVLNKLYVNDSAESWIQLYNKLK